jgi:cytochrome c2
MTSARAGYRAAIALFTVLCSSVAFGSQEPAAVFAKKCSGCHTFGHGDRVGPDLRGVTDRRARPWLQAWIRSSQRLVTARDRTALTLFEKFKRERMPDQSLSEQEIGALLDYFAAGGPLTASAGRARHAATAGAAEIALGRDLFFGARSARSGGASCASCHAVQADRAAPRGGTFGAELTHVYSRFQDAALSDFLRRPCFPRAFPNPDAAPLTDEEAFAVKAFLFQVDRNRPRGSRTTGGW